MTAKISIIIPCFQDEAALSILLPKLQAATQDYDAEIIIIDGAASAVCEEIAAGHNAIYSRETASRGKQIIKGVSLATGGVYWFLHADAMIETVHVQLIIKHVTGSAVGLAVSGGSGGSGGSDGSDSSNNSVGAIEAGFFRFAFAGERNMTKRFLEFWVNLRPQIGGIPYGDQAPFVKAGLYHELGGYQDSPLFEEAQLMRRLKARGKLVAFDNVIKVDPRRWERDGFWRRTFFNRLYAILHMLGVAPERIAGWYRTSATSSPKPSLKQSESISSALKSPAELPSKVSSSSDSSTSLSSTSLSSGTSQNSDLQERP